MNQHMKVFSQPMMFGDPVKVFWNSSAVVPFGLGTNWGVPLGGGDLSGPERLLIGNQLVLLSQNWTVFDGPNYSFQIEAINTQLHYLSTNNNAGSDFQLRKR